jgi:hypothetical protein
MGLYSVVEFKYIALSANTYKTKLQLLTVTNTLAYYAGGNLLRPEKGFVMQWPVL